MFVNRLRKRSQSLPSVIDPPPLFLPFHYDSSRAAMLYRIAHNHQNFAWHDWASLRLEAQIEVSNSDQLSSWGFAIMMAETSTSSLCKQ